MTERNNAVSYGLTLVAGFPLPPAPTAEVMALQAQIEKQFPGRFVWYDASHLHITLAAPLRSRYRAGPPLRRGELPANLDSFVAGLGALLAQVEPFVLKLGAVHLDDEGILLIDVHGGTDVKARITGWLQDFPEFDPPKHPLNHLHISVGYLGETLESPGRSSSDLSAALQDLATSATDLAVPAQIRVDQVWLVHYANRTLSRVIGKLPLQLGQSNPFSAKSLLYGLGIPTC